MRRFTVEQKQIILAKLELILEIAMGEQGYSQYRFVGLCSLNSSSSFDKSEYRLTKAYIGLNRPWITYYRFVLRPPDSWFWWDQGNLEPRIKWLKKHINKLSKDL